jgi:WhiB family redox-sensing transcriptional regulator
MILTNLEQFPNLPDAACSPMTADLFFVTPGESVQPAKAICQLCPEKAACLQWAIDHHIEDGTWGGMTPLERQRFAKGQIAEAYISKPLVPVKRRPCADCSKKIPHKNRRCEDCQRTRRNLQKVAYRARAKAA